jgi:hypothetical protein
MKQLLAFLLVAAVALAACEGDRPVAPPDGPMALVSDGAHTGGNPDFFFLPPLVGNPSSEPTFEPGMFNGRLHPVMSVHALPDDIDPPPPACSGAVKREPAVVSAVPNEEMYQINWDTDDANLTPGTPYRLCVWSSFANDKLGTLLGFVDIAPVTGGMKNVKTGDVFAYQDGRVIPVKFRIEQGALSYDPNDQTRYIVGTEFTVDDGGGSAVLVDESGDTLLAAVDIPAGAISTGDVVTVVVAKEEPQYGETGAPQCLPGGLLQSSWCYQIRTEPVLYHFLKPVRAEICVNVDGFLGNPDDLLVYKSSDGETVEAWPWAEPTLIGSDCSGLPEFGAAKGVFDWLGRWAGRLFAPKELRASVFGTVPKGLGGTGGSFSDFGGAVMPLPDLVVSSLDLQTTSVIPGGWIAYDYTVANIGAEDTAATATFDVATYLSTDQILDSGDLELGSGYSVWTYHLNEGWSRSYADTATVPDTVPPGTYYLIVVADAKPGLPPNNYPGVVETDETNNWTASSGSIAVRLPSSALVACPPSGGGDYIWRGFYVPGLPGVHVDSVELAFSATSPATQDITLVMRDSVFNGTVLGSATATVSVPGGVTAMTSAMFRFDTTLPNIPQWLAFSVSALDMDWYFDTGPCGLGDEGCVPGGACTVVETDDTTPPLSVFRRNSVFIRLFGG